jgi:hypothetical protein
VPFFIGRLRMPGRTTTAGRCVGPEGGAPGSVEPNVDPRHSGMCGDFDCTGARRPSDSSPVDVRGGQSGDVPGVRHGTQAGQWTSTPSFLRQLPEGVDNVDI